MQDIQDFYSIPQKFPNVSSIYKQILDIHYFIPDPADISYISDNYSSTPIIVDSVSETTIPLSGWSGVNLDWIDTIQPSGSYSISKTHEITSSTKISIPPGTTEKGLLLYSNIHIPKNNPEIEFRFTGVVSQNDALLLVMKKTIPPNDFYLYAVKPGSYNGLFHISIPELSNINCAIILGAYHTYPGGKEWTLSDFQMKGEEESIKIYSINPYEGIIGEKTSISLNGSGFESGQKITFLQDGHEPVITEIILTQSSQNASANIPIPSEIEPGRYRVQINQGNQIFDTQTTFEIKEPEPMIIENITPKIIVNNKKVANISIIGQNFHNDSIIILKHPNYGEISPLHYEIISSSIMYAIFPVRDIPTGEWDLMIRNINTDTIKNSGTISIISPGTPIIREISPNSGENTDNNVTLSIKADDLVGNGEIFLSRTGYQPIYATNLKITSSGTITCKMPIVGEPVGSWNLTVKNPNGNQDTLINGFTIFGDRVQPYIHDYDWNLQTEAFGNISRPGGLDITNNGKIAITDLEKPRVFIFQPDGEMILKKELKESGSHIQSYPADIAISNSGYMYIIDKWGSKVLKYTQNGDYLTSWGSQGENPGEFKYPSGICVNTNEEIFVSDTNNHRIQKFDSNGTLLDIWGTKGTYYGLFQFPTGIASNNTDAIYVIDSGNHRVQLFSSEGRIIGAWGDSGNENGNFIAPIGIAIDSLGSVFISDMYKYQVQKFDFSGEFDTKWGVKGEGPGEFFFPGDIGVNNTGYVYTLDTLGGRVSVFEPTNA
ncbi:hypothetical protein KHC33_01235 [Methanospirillum sp. J.3.6.1-F.2.7.3]|uniref:IPT/TIG domain-containing protein n=1 Tax=Methanospirillum purgamenti TaxID=2834276 RepID=A0A8E7EJJ8_9EURY|nr:6-bladed beta-propeller [Methanospirillum sp. J.3.6.1-F.2.7.3]QVV89189.1 hypothetical protein KHC33_01235 [Methanospirillum sp. J.3.6.1-F.2.7.3]